MGRCFDRVINETVRVPNSREPYAAIPGWRDVPDAWQLGVGEERARVAIVGCGGAGCNILGRVVAPDNAIRIAINDAPHPSMIDGVVRVLLPPTSVRAYASMDDMEVEKLETDEEKRVAAALLDRDLVLILGGLGGELGGWAMSLVGRVSRILGDTAVAFTTVPFGLEGPVRRQLAEAQLRLLQQRSGGVVTFANDRLLQVAKDWPLRKAFAALNAIVARPVSSLSASLARSDVPPLRRMLGGTKDWRYGMGAGREKHRCFVAVEEAYASPWFASLPDEVSHAIVLMSGQEAGSEEGEILHEVRRRSPKADLAWSSVRGAGRDDRVVVEILAGV